VRKTYTEQERSDLIGLVRVRRSTVAEAAARRRVVVCPPRLLPELPRPPHVRLPAGLADRVIPRVPVRQWVLTFPHALRSQLACDPELTTMVLRQLIAAVTGWLRASARPKRIRSATKTGAVTVIQRFNSVLDVSQPALSRPVPGRRLQLRGGRPADVPSHRRPAR